MNNDYWEMLDVLYHTGNITQAAKQLFLSQPTLTTRIKTLEEHYGVPLIIRKHRGIMFTPEGEKLVHHARSMLHAQMLIEEKLNNMKEDVVGTLKIGASNFFALNKMPKILRLFKQTYPHVEFQVVTGWSSDIHRKILNHDVHISFIKGEYNWNEEKEMLYEESVCVASPWDFNWGDLPKLSRIDYHTDGKNKIIMDNWWYSNFNEHPNINIQVSQVDTCMEMVINELGYAIMASQVVRPYSELFVKNVHHPTGNPITRRTWMYYHRESLQINLVNAFVQFIKKLDVNVL